MITQFKEVIALVIAGAVIAGINTIKFLPAENVASIFMAHLLPAMLISGLLYMLVIQIKIKTDSIRRIAAVGFFVPIINNVVLVPLSGIPFEQVLQVYPLALLDSLIYAVAAVGIFVLIKKIKA